MIQGAALEERVRHPLRFGFVLRDQIECTGIGCVPHLADFRVQFGVRRLELIQFKRQPPKLVDVGQPPLGNSRVSQPAGSSQVRGVGTA